MSEQETVASPSESPAPGPLDLTQAVWQLRVLVCGFGAALLVLSLAFNAFVWKQNRKLRLTQCSNQTAQLDTRVKQLSSWPTTSAVCAMSVR
jgi:hypothetical protein